MKKVKKTNQISKDFVLLKDRKVAPLDRNWYHYKC